MLRRLRPLPPLDLDLTQAYGNVLAEDVIAPHAFPAFDQAAIDGYAARWEDIAGRPSGYTGRRFRHSRGPFGSTWSATSARPVGVRFGSTPAPVSRSRPARRCRLRPTWSSRPSGPTRAWPRWRCIRAPKRGYGVRRAGEEVARRRGARPRRHATSHRRWSRSSRPPASVTWWCVRSPRVVIVATGDELVDVGRASQPGQVVDANSHALTAAAAEAGAHAYRVGICDDDPEGLRGLLEDQTLRADLIITTGGTGTGPGDMVRRILSRRDGAVRSRSPRCPSIRARRSASARSGPRRCRWCACPATRVPR